jgi:hypothetical protein
MRGPNTDTGFQSLSAPAPGVEFSVSQGPCLRCLLLRGRLLRKLLLLLLVVQLLRLHVHKQGAPGLCILGCPTCLKFVGSRQSANVSSVQQHGRPTSPMHNVNELGLHSANMKTAISPIHCAVHE